MAAAFTYLFLNVFFRDNYRFRVSCQKMCWEVPFPHGPPVVPHLWCICSTAERLVHPGNSFRFHQFYSHSFVCVCVHVCVFSSRQFSLVAQTAKASACNAGDLGLIRGSERSPGEGNGNPLQYSCLENPMDRRAWRAVFRGVAKSRTRLSS